jgi:hypothetical protein
MKRFTTPRRESRLFAVGSTLFALGAVFASIPGLPGWLAAVTYFAGSVCFTSAALIQWLLSGRPSFSGWRGAAASDWWSAAIQFLGTLFFNISTFAAMVEGEFQNASSHVWRPDVYGSAAFLISSLLALKASTQRDRLWDPEARVWRVTWFNLLGSVAFGVSAVAARTSAPTGPEANPMLDNLGTFVGALGFLAAALLMAPRSESRASKPA